MEIQTLSCAFLTFSLTYYDQPTSSNWPCTITQNKTRSAIDTHTHKQTQECKQPTKQHTNHTRTHIHEYVPAQKLYTQSYDAMAAVPARRLSHDHTQTYAHTHTRTHKGRREDGDDEDDDGDEQEEGNPT